MKEMAIAVREPLKRRVRTTTSWIETLDEIMWMAVILLRLPLAFTKKAGRLANDAPERWKLVPQMISNDNVNQKVPPPSSYRWIPLFTVWYQIGVRHANLQAKSQIDNSTAGFAADLLGAQTLLPEGSIGIPVDWRGVTV
jgi:hypothetical protein